MGLVKIMFNIYLRALKLYFVFKGKATRQEWWLFNITAAFIGFILYIISLELGLYSIRESGEIVVYISAIYGMLMYIPYLSISIRRIKDTGLSGWWGWLFIPLCIPIVRRTAKMSR